MRPHLAVAGIFYLALTIWFTWPLAQNLDRQLPCTTAACTYDTLYSSWVLAWQTHALATAANVGDANIYHPDTHALFYGPAGFGAVPYFAPTFLVSGNAALATNVLVILCVALAGLTLHAVVRAWTGLATAGFVAAWCLYQNRFFLWGFYDSSPHLMPLLYVPLVIYLAATPIASAGRALLLLAVVVAQCLVDLAYVAPGVLAPLVVIASWRILWPESRASGLRLAAVVAAALLCLMPVLRGYAWVRTHNPHLEAQTLSPPVGNTVLVPGVPGHDPSVMFWMGGTPAVAPPAALLVIGVGLAVAWLRRSPSRPTLSQAWRHGLLWAIGGTLMTLTPLVTWQGHDYLPHYLLDVTTPFYSMVRIPTRLGFTAMFGLAVLVGLAFAETMGRLGDRVAERWRPALFVGAAAILAILIHAFPPPGSGRYRPQYPRQGAPTTPDALLAKLRATDGPLLELPVLWKTGLKPNPRVNARAMYRSTRHWRPLLNGYSSYWPAGFVERMRAAEALPDEGALRRLVCATGVRSVLVNLFAYPRAKRRQWFDATLRPPAGLSFAGTFRSQLLFEVTLPATDCSAFSFHDRAPRVS